MQQYLPEVETKKPQHSILCLCRFFTDALPYLVKWLTGSRFFAEDPS
jgi:hypothetical protein